MDPHDDWYWQCLSLALTIAVFTFITMAIYDGQRALALIIGALQQ